MQYVEVEYPLLRLEQMTNLIDEHDGHQLTVKEANERGYFSPVKNLIVDFKNFLNPKNS